MNYHRPKDNDIESKQEGEFSTVDDSSNINKRRKNRRQLAHGSDTEEGEFSVFGVDSSCGPDQCKCITCGARVHYGTNMCTDCYTNKSATKPKQKKPRYLLELKDHNKAPVQDETSNENNHDSSETDDDHIPLFNHRRCNKNLL